MYYVLCIADVGFVAGSYLDDLTLGVAGRRGSFANREELRHFMELFEHEVHELYQYAVSRSSDGFPS
jgi:hypothetical protein